MLRILCIRVCDGGEDGRVERAGSMASNIRLSGGWRFIDVMGGDTAPLQAVSWSGDKFGITP
jgi:hypothetical protein